MKLYIAEDEEWIRKGIKKMIRWEEMGLQLVGEADNGIAALKEILQLQPDILLADIRMPGMDGLELARDLKDKIPTKVIFISGYKEFEYAKTAVELSAVNYLLKPVDPEKLNQVIREAADSVVKERSNGIDSENRGYLLRVLEEQVVPAKEEQKFFAVLLMPAGNLRIDREFEEKVQAILDNYRNKGLKGEIYKKSRDEYVIIFSASNKQAFSLHLKGCLDLVWNISAGDEIWSLGTIVNKMSDIPLSYNEAWQAYVHRPIKRKEGIIYFDEMNSVGTAVLSLIEEMEKILLSAESGDAKRIKKEVDELFLNIEDREDMGVQELVDSIFYMAIDFLGRIQKKGVATTRYYNMCQELSRRRFQVKSTDEVKIWFLTFLNGICEELRREQAKSIQLAVEQVAAFIDRHYMEEISLGKMAEMVWLNATYLSSSFKKITGVNYSDYIMKKRIEKAAGLIRNTQLGIGEIAGMVGYDNVRYFSRIFSKNMGMTPSQYRDSHREITDED